MFPLAAYRDLIDLSPPTSQPPLNLPHPEILALTFLYAEHAANEGNVDAASEHVISHLPYPKRVQLIRTLLTLRAPSLGPLPPGALDALDAHLAHLSSTNPDPLVPIQDVASVPAALFPSVPASALAPLLDRIAFFRGDITRLASKELAIVNPANTRMLGCFQPSHLCADNVIHAAAGPRLRLDCFKIMSTQDSIDADVSEAIVTRGWSLPAAFVLHVAGPQLERGAQPTSEEKALLSDVYTNCLDLAEAVGGISRVAFPCVSTGLFAFPGDQAAQIAISSVLSWMSSHPTSAINVIFALFSPADTAHYLAAVSCRFPLLPPPLSLARHFALPDRVRDWVVDSDSLIIHCGAGLSADAVKPELRLPLDYTSRELFKKLYPALLESTEMRMLYHSIGYEFDDLLVKWAFILGHADNTLSWGTTPIYTTLLSYALSKSSYTVLTSNADNLFRQSDFDPSRIYTPQGTYANFQCLMPCTPTSFFPALPWIERARLFIHPKTMRLPEDRPDLVPKCDKCGGEVFLNVRGGDWFLETPQEGQRERYLAQVEEMVGRARDAGKSVAVLEIGAGFNTPGVVRFPSEQLVRKYGGTVKLVRVNLTHPEVPDDIRENAMGVKIGAVEFFSCFTPNV